MNWQDSNPQPPYWLVSLNHWPNKTKHILRVNVYGCFTWWRESFPCLLKPPGTRPTSWCADRRARIRTECRRLELDPAERISTDDPAAGCRFSSGDLFRISSDASLSTSTLCRRRKWLAARSNHRLVSLASLLRRTALVKNSSLRSKTDLSLLRELLLLLLPSLLLLLLSLSS